MKIENPYFTTLPGIRLAGELLFGATKPVLTPEGMRAIEDALWPKADPADRRLDMLQAQQSAESMRDTVLDRLTK